MRGGLRKALLGLHVLLPVISSLGTTMRPGPQGRRCSFVALGTQIHPGAVHLCGTAPPGGPFYIVYSRGWG